MNTRTTFTHEETLQLKVGELQQEVEALQRKVDHLEQLIKTQACTDPDCEDGVVQREGILGGYTLSECQFCAAQQAAKRYEFRPEDM